MQTAMIDAAAEAGVIDDTGATAQPVAEATGDRQPTGEAAEQSPAEPTSLRELLETGTEDQVRAAMRQIESGGSLPAEPVAEVSDDGTGQEETALVAQAEGEDDEAKKGSPRRIQIHRFPAKDQALLIAAQDLVRENKGLSLAEALAQVGFEFNPKPAAEAAAPVESEKPVEPETPLAQAAQKVADLKAKRLEAKNRFDFEEENRLEEELEQAREQLRKMTSAAEAAQDQANQKRAAREEAEFGRLLGHAEGGRTRRVRIEGRQALLDAGKPGLDAAGRRGKAEDGAQVKHRGEFGSGPLCCRAGFPDEGIREPCDAELRHLLGDALQLFVCRD